MLNSIKEFSKDFGVGVLVLSIFLVSVFLISWIGSIAAVKAVVLFLLACTLIWSLGVFVRFIFNEQKEIQRIQKKYDEEFKKEIAND